MAKADWEIPDDDDPDLTALAYDRRQRVSAVELVNALLCELCSHARVPVVPGGSRIFCRCVSADHAADALKRARGKR